MKTAEARKHALLTLSLALSALVFDAPSSKACSCGDRPTVLEQTERADIIVITQVISVEKAAESERSVDGVRSTKVIVEKVFKGPIQPGEEMVFGQGGGANCIWTFNEKDVGKRYLFYLSSDRRAEKLWIASVCGRSTSTEYAADDLLYLENLSKVRGKTRLSGTLSFYQPSAVEDQDEIHNSLAGRKVKVIGEKKTYELVTNRDGVYEIYDLPAGQYAIEPEVPDSLKIASKDGSLRPGDDNKDSRTSKKISFQVLLEPGKHAFYDFSYGINNAIRGNVFDTAGNPMMGVWLEILPAQGKAKRYFSKTAYTKKDGSFEIDGIPPGAYLLAINKDGRISSAQPFETFYYPNVFDREKAVVINIGPGHFVENLSVHAPKMEETITVQGVCSYSSGKPVIEGWVNFEPETTLPFVEGKARAQIDSSGRFSIKILKGLKGKLYSELYAFAGMYENCPKVDELLKKSGDDGVIRTNSIEIQAENNLTNTELRYPFPACKKAR